jgi:hypothetical protein
VHRQLSWRVDFENANENPSAMVNRGLRKNMTFHPVVGIYIVAWIIVTANRPAEDPGRSNRDPGHHMNYALPEKESDNGPHRAMLLTVLGRQLG